MICYIIVAVLVIILIWQYWTITQCQQQIDLFNRRETLWSNIRSYMMAYNNAWFNLHAVNNSKSEIPQFPIDDRNKLIQLFSTINTNANAVGLDERSIQTLGYFPVLGYR